MLVIFFCWKTINVYLLCHHMSLPSLSLISSKLPMLSYHWYFVTKDLFGLGCCWKPAKELCVREEPKQKKISLLQTKFVQAWMKHMKGCARRRGKKKTQKKPTVVLLSKRTFQGILFPICSLLLHFAPILTECSLSVTVKDSLFIETGRWMFMWWQLTVCMYLRE